MVTVTYLSAMSRPLIGDCHRFLHPEPWELNRACGTIRHTAYGSTIYEAIWEIPAVFPLTFLRRGKTELRWSNLQKESYTTHEMSNLPEY